MSRLQICPCDLVLLNDLASHRAGDLVLNIEVEGGGYEEYTVVAGDNLTKIGKQWGKNWKEIWDANRTEVPDYNKIYPGQKLRIPK